MTEPILHKNLAILRVTEARVLDEIRAVVPLLDYSLGILSETEVIVDPSRLRELREALDARGLQALVKRV